MSLTRNWKSKEPNALRDFINVYYPYGSFGVIWHNMDVELPTQFTQILTKNPDLVNRTWHSENSIWTALLLLISRAAGLQKNSLIEVLLSHGADPNITGFVQFIYQLFYVPFSEIWVGDVSPLYVAARERDTTVMKMLLDVGANALHVSSNGETVLHSLYSLNCPSDDAVVLLLEKGIDVNAQDNQGRTPLHCALENCPPCEIDKAVITLIEKGASVDIKNNLGRNAVQLAALNGYVESVEYMMRIKQLKEHWPADDVANVYEILGQRPWRSTRYEMLRKATIIRQKEHCPKEVQEPLDCYGEIEEWKTKRQLSNMRNDVHLLHTHCLIAHERIFKDSPIPLQPLHDYILKCHRNGDPNTILLIKRLIKLFHRNGNYRLFFEVFIQNILHLGLSNSRNEKITNEGGILSKLLFSPGELSTPRSRGVSFMLKWWGRFGQCLYRNERCDATAMVRESERELLPEFLPVAMESCQRLAESAKEQKKASDFQNIASAFERTVRITLSLIERLETHMDVCPYLRKLSNICDIEVTEYNYRRSLLLIYCDRTDNCLYSLTMRVVDVDMIRQLTKYSDCRVTDEFDNNCLHLLVDRKTVHYPTFDFLYLGEAKQAIHHLIREGIHYDGRNSMGYTAEELAEIKSPRLYAFMEHNRPIFSLKCQAAKVIKTQIVGFELKLPKPLSDFVALH